MVLFSYGIEEMSEREGVKQNHPNFNCQGLTLIHAPRILSHDEQ